MEDRTKKRLEDAWIEYEAAEDAWIEYLEARDKVKRLLTPGVPLHSTPARFEMAEDAEPGDIVEVGENGLAYVINKSDCSGRPCDDCMEDFPPAIGVKWWDHDQKDTGYHSLFLNKGDDAEYLLWRHTRIQELAAGVMLWFASRHRVDKPWGDARPLKFIPWSRVIEVMYE
jgi:hypothetical protein